MIMTMKFMILIMIIMIMSLFLSLLVIIMLNWKVFISINNLIISDFIASLYSTNI